MTNWFFAAHVFALTRAWQDGTRVQDSWILGYENPQNLKV